MQQADGRLAQITEAYNAGNLGAVFSQFLNGTSTGLAAFAPMLTTALGSRYYNPQASQFVLAAGRACQCRAQRGSES